MSKFDGKLKSTRRSSGAEGILNARKDSIRELTQGLAKVPPHATEVEEAVLGAIMIEKSAYMSISHIVRSENLYDDRNVRIFMAMRRLSDRSSPIDLITLSNELRTTAELEIVGGLPYLVELTNKVNSAANIEFHARIIVEYALKRELIAIGAMIEKQAYNDDTDAFKLIDDIGVSLSRISDFRGSQKAKSLGQIQVAWAEVIKKAKESGGVVGVPYGFSEMDLYTCGKVAGELTVIAARPGMGKTLFMLQSAKNAAKNFGFKIGMFQLEMKDVQLYSRLVASEIGLENSQIRRGNIEDYQHMQIHNNAFLRSDMILIDDFTDTDAETLMRKSAKMVLEDKVQEIWLDYLQLVDGEGNNREQVISKISRTCKKIAKAFNIPVIALSQLSREVEKRPDKRPMLSDLRESGAIEQDADVVVFLWRPEYYNITKDEKGMSLEGKICAIIAKNRTGALDDVWLDCDLAKSTIRDPVDNLAAEFATNDIPKSVNGLAAFGEAPKPEVKNSEMPF